MSVLGRSIATAIITARRQRTHALTARRRMAGALASVLAAGLIAVTAASPGAALAQAAPFCAPGQTTAFRFGIGALQERLGPIMGAPLECEHVDAASGDTVQQTTTGLAYFRPSLNTPMFTDGTVHYALAADGKLLLWRGDAAALPPLDPVESAYLTLTQPYRDNLGSLLTQLAEDQRLADAGQIEQVDRDALSVLANDLATARRVIANPTHPPRLDRYVQVVDMALTQAFNAADMLFHARRTDSDAERATLIANARSLTTSSVHLQQEAEQTLSTVVPVVVTEPLVVSQQ